jgi:hypothetical protein
MAEKGADEVQHLLQQQSRLRQQHHFNWRQLTHK